MGDNRKPELTISVKDIRAIKNAAFGHIHDVLPRNLDHKEIQTLLICKGFANFLSYKGITLPVTIKFEWDKNTKS